MHQQNATKPVEYVHAVGSFSAYFLSVAITDCLVHCILIYCLVCMNFGFNILLYIVLPI
jgi:hypothetical protein